MSIRILKRSGCRCALLITLLLTAGVARGERLPLKAYTTTEGLAHNVVNKIVRDSRGFLWFCTNEGLARFDGYTFTNYGTNEGLPHSTVTETQVCSWDLIGNNSAFIISKRRCR
jgi:ligand-binding sensor domain-containing protein